MLPVDGKEHAINSDDVFLLKEQPKRMVILGGGYIAAEFACIFNGLGTDVTLVNRSPTVLKAFDADLQTHIIEEMEKKGIRMLLGQTPERIEAEGDQRRVTLSGGEVLEADTVFMAAGRSANTDGLGLETAGIETGRGGIIPVDGFSRTSAPSVFAVGDVTGRAELTPVPEIGTVGMTEAEARAAHDVEIYKAAFRPMVHTLSGRDEKMLMKMIVDKANRKMLGVHIVGHGSGEMIQCVGIAMKMGATKEDFDRTMAVHPTAAEELVTMKAPIPEA